MNGNLGNSSLRWVLKKGSLYKRGPIFWLLYYEPGTGERRRVSLKTINLIEAEERRLEIIASACGLGGDASSASAGTATSAPGSTEPLNYTTVLEAFETYLRLERGRGEKSIISDIGRIKAFFARAGS